MLSEKDKVYLLEAFKEALKSDYKSFPNPKVGCVIVKNGKIIGRGYHKIFGGPHAEVNAINSAKENVAGSTMYVTLEPCSTYGKTPPCTELIINSKIKRVVCGSIDPNPLHSGKGLKILRNANIICEVANGKLKRMCEEINELFFKNMKKTMPYITLKLAISLDGKIADKNYNSKWISSEKSRKYTQLLRAYSDCIIIGTNTLIKDNPYLTVRDFDVLKQPDVCIIGKKFKVFKNLKLFSKKRRVFLINNMINNKNKINKPNIEFITVKPSFLKKGIIDLNKLMKDLYNYGIRHVLVEGGAFTIKQFINQNLFDKIILFISPLIIGEGINWFDTKLILKNSELGLRLKTIKTERIEDDLYMELKNV